MYGPPGAEFGSGVNRTSGIIVSGSRPHDCSSARPIPETPVPVRNALSSALKVRSNVDDIVDVVTRMTFLDVVDRVRRGDDQLQRVDQVRSRLTDLLQRALRQLQVGVEIGSEPPTTCQR